MSTKTTSHLRGRKIDNVWVYSDTGLPVAETHNLRSCGRCNKGRTIEGHDACLGTLKGIMNACCGHGIEKEASIQFLDGFSIHGKDAVTILNILKLIK